MTLVKDLRRRFSNYYDSLELLRIVLHNGVPFPLSFTVKITQKEITNNYGEIKEAISEIERFCDAFALDIEYKNVRHKVFGTQSVPYKIICQTHDAFFAVVRKKEEFEYRLKLANDLITKVPPIRSFILSNIKQFVEYDQKWPQLIQVILFFLKNPRPNKFIRALDIPGVDTKFIEENKKILSKLFDYILPTTSFNSKITGVARNKFERKYYLKYEQPRVRFRVLDQTMSIAGMTDLEIPLSQFLMIDVKCRNVLIVENKMNGLIIPDCENTLLIFGMGYAVHLLKNVDWLKDKNIFYWGDIDTHGFAILSLLRGYFPHVRSVLMDYATLKKYQHLAGKENVEKRTTSVLSNLTEDETILYRDLCTNRYGEYVRLEQERIGFNYCWEKISKQL
ncbi:MAG: Wadjet anti-phage system protein JetD domain-containing protein [bacterium]